MLRRNYILSLHDLIEIILTRYSNERKNKIAHNKLASLLRKGLHNVVSEDLLGEDHQTKGSAGQGQWSIVPWIGIFDKSISTTAQKGFDIVYLFSPDMQKVYLSLNQGWTLYKENFGNEAFKKIQTVSYYWQNNLKTRSSRMNDTPIDLQSNIFKTSNLPKGYELGNIFSICYEKNKLPDNEIMVQDLRDMIICLSELRELLINKNKILQSIEYILTNTNTKGSLSIDIEKISNKLSSINLIQSKNALKSFSGKKIDFQRLSEQNAKIGFLGEKLVFESEKKRLRDYPDLVNKIKHVSLDEGDGLGFDILSFDETGKKKYIEVKTTTSGQTTPFFLSRNELAFSKEHSSDYFLYRIFNLDNVLKSDNVQYFVKKGNLQDYFKLEPQNYSVTLK